MNSRARKVRLAVAAASCLWLGCWAPPRPVPGESLLTPETLSRWRQAAAYANSPPWTLDNGVYEGQDSWVGYGEIFTDFVLECEFFFEGKGEGGIVIRVGDQTHRGAKHHVLVGLHERLELLRICHDQAATVQGSCYQRIVAERKTLA